MPGGAPGGAPAPPLTPLQGVQARTGDEAAPELHRSTLVSHRQGQPMSLLSLNVTAHKPPLTLSNLTDPPHLLQWPRRSGQSPPRHHPPHGSILGNCLKENSLNKQATTYFNLLCKSYNNICLTSKPTPQTDVCHVCHHFHFHI